MQASFVWKMAWRDSRSSRQRLLVFSISITLGIAALVGIGSFRHSLSRAIDDQARTLIGADLIVENSRAFTPEEESLLHSLGEPQAREVRFSTMAVFPASNGTHLVSLRALGGDFPFYGKMETEPPKAAQDFRLTNGVVAEEALLIQFGAKVGDRMKIGDAEFPIVGVLKKMPGEASAGGSLAPRVYIPLQELATTNLLRPGSVVRYRNYVKFPPNVDVNARIASIAPHLQRFGLEFDTVEKRKKDIGNALENLYRFLNLVGFIALLLGAVGVASAIQAHLQQKQKTGAILRCLGASAGSTVVIYLLQAAAMGLIGATAGASLGVLMQRVFPAILKGFISIPVDTSIAWQPIVRGMFLGFAICILFALPSLLRFRRLSPLLILRASTADESRRPDRLIAIIYVVIAASVTAFAISQTDTWKRGLIFAGVLGLAIATFAGMAKLLMFAVRKFFPQRWSFAARQGLANLYRPNNRTLLLTIALGLGTFLLLNLYLSREVLLAQFRSIDFNNQPNIFLFDIQTDQTEGVADLVRSLGLPVIQQAPIVTMRLSEIKGRAVSDLLADPSRKMPEWELQREYRCTYREELANTEKIVAGKWIGRVDYKPGDAVPISIDKEIAKDFGAGIGDELVFDVQGIPIRTKIASTRDIDWKRFQTNFFVVFPAGVLESAPTFHVLVSRVQDAAASANLQSVVVAKFSNVSALDLTSVIQTVD
ncbi:MAG: ABC transporter permease, partial [Chthoniobacterales bacterium]